MSDSRVVFFFDIDNCLYSKKTKVLEATDVLIHKFFKEALSLDDESAVKLRLEYLKNYGLIVEGLAANHGIKPLDFNHQIDDALPLENLIKPDAEVCKLLEDIDKTKVKLWLFTNAYVHHAKRVVKLLGIEHLFEGLTYCDYGATPLRCKPHVEMFVKAMHDAGAAQRDVCYFIDDSKENCRQAETFGWTTVHLVEDDIQPSQDYKCRYQITHLGELGRIFPGFLKDTGRMCASLSDTRSFSNLDIVKIADAFPYPNGNSTLDHYFHFRIASHPDLVLGYVLPEIAFALKSERGWELDTSRSPKTLTMITGDDETARSATMDRTARSMRASRRFKLLDKWRDELFPVYGPDKELLFSIERSASPLFGVVVYGVNMTAYRWSCGDDNQRLMEIWVPRRSSDRAKFPNMLDSSVGGGLNTGETPWSCLIRESEEEASLEEALVRSAKEAGTVSYFYVSGEGSGGEKGLAQPERSYVFDLDLTGHPRDALTIRDDSVAAFVLLTIADVKSALRRKEFKPNCALVILDFLIRHKQLTADEEPELAEIRARLHRNLEFPVY